MTWLQVRVDAGGRADGRPVSTVTAAGGRTKTPTPVEVQTMQVDRAQLARRIGLPANASESMVRARLAGVEVASQVRAAQVARTGRRLGAGSVQAASNEELRSLSASGLSGADQDAVNDEMAHRQIMAQHYPGAVRSPDGRVRVHHSS